jgi:hypothetical protein
MSQTAVALPAASTARLGLEAPPSVGSETSLGALQPLPTVSVADSILGFPCAGLLAQIAVTLPWPSTSTSGWPIEARDPEMSCGGLQLPPAGREDACAVKFVPSVRNQTAVAFPSASTTTFGDWAFWGVVEISTGALQTPSAATGAGDAAREHVRTRTPRRTPQDIRQPGARARYLLPVRRVMVRLRRKSRTATLPRVTLVRVPSQRSSVIHLVPRTVAAE